MDCHNTKEAKFLTPLCFGLSHLCNHKFKRSFQDPLNALWFLIMASVSSWRGISLTTVRHTQIKKKVIIA